MRNERIKRPLSDGPISINMEKLKTQEKTQNSSKKLKTQAENSGFGRHLPLTCPQVMLKKKPDLPTSSPYVGAVLVLTSPEAAAASLSSSIAMAMRSFPEAEEGSGTSTTVVVTWFPSESSFTIWNCCPAFPPDDISALAMELK